MKRLVGLVLGLVTVAAFAASEDLRAVAIAQLRAIAEPLFAHGESTDPQFDAFYADMVEALPPQERAERALELAINRYAGAAEYVIATAPGWRGQIAASERLAALIETALSAPRIEIRMAAYETYLAQFGLDKTSAQVDALLARLREDPQGAGPWALWSLAMIGARGVERERVFAELLLATRVDDDTLRRWAVDALARLGGVEVIEPLLQLATDDRSALIQERAFCGLAASGTLHLAERYEALPGLLRIAADPQRSAQQHAWSYQALREISGLYDGAETPAAWQLALETSGLLGGKRP
jgi:hypothetical protein